jgi:peroxiredoxin family protein
MLDDSNSKSMSIIATKGTLDWAYPPFILGTTAAAMDLEVTMFFTFYGLTLLKKDLNLKMSTLGNPAMEMPMMGMHMAMPNIIGGLPGVDKGVTSMMKNMTAECSEISNRTWVCGNDFQNVTLRHGFQHFLCFEDREWAVQPLCVKCMYGHEVGTFLWVS